MLSQSLPASGLGGLFRVIQQRAEAVAVVVKVDLAEC